MKKIFLFWALLTATLCSAQDDNTPMLGWSSWNAFGLDISEELIKEQADAMVNTGLKDAGYCYINIDDGYFHGRDERGKLLVNPETFPSGFPSLVSYIHKLGLKAGIYNDAGHSTCGCNGTKDPLCMNVGLYGHDHQDADFFFNECDFDFIKIDFCGGSGGNAVKLRLDERSRYTDIYNAINTVAHKNIRINVCRWAYPGTWVKDVCGSWRTTGDVRASWDSVKKIIFENLYLSAYSSKGHFNDMDMLEVGRGLPEEEDKTHFGMWCIMNSPLLIGCDMRNISAEALALLTNNELLEVNQDKTFQQAYVAQKTNDCYVLVRDVARLYGEERVVALYNPNDEVKQVKFNISDIDLEGEVSTVRDLFEHADVTKEVFSSKQQTISVKVPAHGTKIYRVKAQKRLERRRYEAETAFNPSYQEIINNQTINSGIYTYDDNCSGGLKATWLGTTEENALHFQHVRSNAGGTYNLTIAYLSEEERALQVLVNNKEVKRIVVAPQPENTVATTMLDINLDKGENTIVLTNAGGWMPDIDYIELTPAK